MPTINSARGASGQVAISVALCLIVALATAALAAPADAELRFKSPAKDALVTAKKLRVVVAGAKRGFEAIVGSKDVTRRFSKPRRGVRKATLRRGRDFVLGWNQLVISGPGGYLTRRFEALLGADEGARFGPNKLVVRAVGPRARHDRAVLRFKLRRSAPLVGAGPERSTVGGRATRLDGRSTRSTRRRGKLRYRWRIVRAPKDSRARLKGARRARPRLRPDVNGTYEVRLRARARVGAERSIARASTRRPPFRRSGSRSTRSPTAASGSAIGRSPRTRTGPRWWRWTAPPWRCWRTSPWT